MSEDVDLHGEYLGKKDPIIIPDGFDLVVVKVGEQDSVEANCPQCGGASLHTSANCVYCGTSRTHYEYQKKGSENEVDKIIGRSPMMAKITVEDGSFEGAILAKEVRIGEDSVVGDIQAGDNAYLAKKAKAGFVFSPIIRTEEDVEISQMATSVLTASGPLKAGIVTIYNGGSLNIPLLSRIGELRLGKGVEEPPWYVKFGIKKIVHDDIGLPKDWEK